MAVSVSKQGNSVYLELGVWYQADQDHIHLTAKGVPGFHTTVTRDPSSKRGHPNLFGKLGKVLKEAGAPHPTIEEADDAQEDGAAGETVADKIVHAIKNNPGQTERELAEAIFGKGARQQRVNGDCALLANRGEVERRGAGGPSDPFRYFPKE